LQGIALMIPGRSAAAPAKWRPSLSLVVFLVLASVLLLPLFSLYFLKVYQNQLIRETESELIAQSAALAAVFHREVESTISQDVALGAKAAPAVQAPTDGPYQPIWPKLELANESVLPPRPEARPPALSPNPAFVALGARMTPDLAATQNVTLAGFRLLIPTASSLPAARNSAFRSRIWKKSPKPCKGGLPRCCACGSRSTTNRRSIPSAGAPGSGCSRQCR
jgi:hypothetical protein